VEGPTRPGRIAEQEDAASWRGQGPLGRLKDRLLDGARLIDHEEQVLGMKALQRFRGLFPGGPCEGTPVRRPNVHQPLLRQVKKRAEVQGGMVPTSGALLIGMAPPLTQLAPENIAELMAARRRTGHFGIIVAL